MCAAVTYLEHYVHTCESWSLLRIPPHRFEAIPHHFAHPAIMYMYHVCMCVTNLNHIHISVMRYTLYKTYIKILYYNKNLLFDAYYYSDIAST